MEIIKYEFEKVFQNIEEKENEMENMKKNFTEDQFQSPQIYFLGIQNRKQ